MFNKNKTITDLRRRLFDEESRHNLEVTKLSLKLENAEGLLKLSQERSQALTDKLAGRLDNLIKILSSRSETPTPPPAPERPKPSAPIIDVNLNDYVILRPDSYPCDQCPLEHTQCKKLSFHDQTICITHKDAVPKIL
ncbi:MAG: hypothetical protein K6A96_10975 [Prevotella sp.]|nr:hypothetical protein [Prevotella sp.]